MTIFEQRTHEQLQQVSQHICDLTLRDLFAMSALNGMYANDTYFTNASYREVAEIAYRQADEMLKERKEK
jgi:hypothetical protein